MHDDTADVTERPPLKRLEARLGHVFADRSLLVLALTHSSSLNENQALTESNERLEFLGDAVLELSVSEEFYARFPKAREGELTRLRARLVKEPSLAALGREIGVSENLILGRGEEAQGGRDRDGLLADAVEAVLGAIFLDAGYAAASACVRRLFVERWPEEPDLPRTKDYKTLLQEVTQKSHRERPVYVLAEMDGPDHAKVYRLRVELPDGTSYVGEGRSKKKAEQAAARKALIELNPELL